MSPTVVVPDELLILTFEALEERLDPGWSSSNFASFRTDWTLAHVEERGSRLLSCWRGPDADAIMLLTEGLPPERTLAIVDHRPHARRLVADARMGSFLQPGFPLREEGGRLEDFGIFAGWWPCESGAKRLRLTRHGKIIEIEAASGAFILVDWDDPAVVARFEAVELEGTGWVPTAVPMLPYTGKHLFDGYRRFKLNGMDWSEQNPDLWAYEAFTIQDPAWLDLVVAFLHHADPDRDRDLLLNFGAYINGNGNTYYERMEYTLKAGMISPETLGIVLSMEKPDFMDDALQIRHQRLVARCKPPSRKS